ncbi:hypothetical protein C3Y87_17105 [Carbonactinospora thermoautotrophica]|uniref:SHOCT domain-containing protein n=3 Tax=Carbonactinospora thermoautotrophica TaxID=1469144 RepID=A0A132MSV6_9ACTN|nr:hypothetical protein LI90_1927 [Carbonactinospora thermoautotrophica]MCX9193101.1 hypothetical protein [Carbonactinospora thermoautotrophica]
MFGCGWGWGGMGGGMAIVGWVLMAVFWIALIALIVWAVVRLVQAGDGRYRGGQHPETPEEILARRFASGEIDAATYDEARARLAQRRPEPR